MGHLDSIMPESIKEHQHKYKPDAWFWYEAWEYGMWVHLLMKRSAHRSDDAKRKKDLDDAQNYLDMLQARLNDLKEAK